MTAEDALDAEPTAFEDTVFEDRFNHVLTACRGIATGRRCKRRDENPIEIDGDEEDFSYENLPCLMFDV